MKTYNPPNRRVYGGYSVNGLIIPKSGMHPLTYLHLRMQLEGIGLVGDRLVLEAEALPDGGLPLVLIARLSTAEVVVYHNDSLPIDLHRKLSASARGIKFPSVASLIGLLQSNDIRVKADHCKTYIFSTNPADSVDRDVARYPGNDPRLQGFGSSGFPGPVYVIECDGQVVSACASARENSQCGEAWVRTDPAYRKRGFAAKVVQAWANNLIGTGKIPLYSHEAGNKASADLARHMGLKPVFQEINIIPLSK